MTRLLLLGATVLAVLNLGTRNVHAEDCGSGEDCIAGVRALAPWTSAIRGNAGDWPVAARKAGFVVDTKLANGAVLVYPGNYGSGISPLGHVAVIVDAKPVNGKIKIQDSSPDPKGWSRQIRLVSAPDMRYCVVIHPK